MASQASIRPYLNQAYLLGLLMVAVGLTLSPFLMGMSQFWLVFVWLVDGIIGNRDENVNLFSSRFQAQISSFLA